MWSSLSIGKKIWVSIAILIVGYFLSMAYGFINGFNTQKRLVRVSDHIFPASMESRTALNAFKEQVKLYSDAIMLGDEDSIKAALNKSTEASSSLQIVSGFDIDKKTNEQVQEAIIKLKAFTSKAQKVYLALATQAEGDYTDQAAELAKQTKDLQNNYLKPLAESFSNQLKEELSSIGNNSKRQQYLNLILFILVVTFSSLLVSFIISRFISNPLNESVKMVNDIAEGEGDLTKRLIVNSKDEVGELSKWFNMFLNNLQRMVSDITDNAKTLNESSHELSDLSNAMAEGSAKMSDKANSVANSAGDMNEKMDSVAAAMEEASTNTEFVAGSTEEMTKTINEIAMHSEKARSITDQAVEKANVASGRVKELGLAANDVGKVTETITEISEQTNLLALNATIEAARAGEAGKGFAVVANEIKDLAKQTADATQDIKQKIGGIQGATAGTVSDIEQISQVINDVTEIVSIIATAVEEQSATTKEISENVLQLSQGLQEINVNVSQSTVFSGQIAKDIADVNNSATDVSNSSSQMHLSIGQLTELASSLKELVSKFKV